MIIFWIICLILLVFCLTVFFGAPYVPSQRKFVKKAFSSIYPLSDIDVLIDIGSGDGVVLREAARRGAKAIGYEINPILYIVSKVLCRSFDGIDIRLANFWMTQLPDDVTVVYAFSVNRDNARLDRRMQSEANRLNRPLVLLCFGSPLATQVAEKEENAYHRYTFRPMQEKTLTV